MTALLSVENLSKRFGGLQAVADVSLDVTSGEICSVIGPNGAGKTTLFNMISGVLRPSGGRILFDGIDLATVSPSRFAAIGIGRTFQNLALFKHGTVVENILTGRHTHLRSNVLDAVIFFGRTRREEIEARQRVEHIIEFLEIEHIRDAVVGTLSYGQQKRVELARALACEPKLLLLDEMVSGMNQEETEDIARFVLDIRDELGITVLMIEHEMRIVMDISDRVHVLNFGRKIAEGTPAEVRRDPAVDGSLSRRPPLGSRCEGGCMMSTLDTHANSASDRAGGFGQEHVRPRRHVVADRAAECRDHHSATASKTRRTAWRQARAAREGFWHLEPLFLEPLLRDRAFRRARPAVARVKTRRPRRHRGRGYAGMVLRRSRHPDDRRYRGRHLSDQSVGRAAIYRPALRRARGHIRRPGADRQGP